MIVITNDPCMADAVTHNGLFHADDVMAAAILSFGRELRLLRSISVPRELARDAVVYDMGGGPYDHHQPGGNGTRTNGIHFSSCGLIWRDYGVRAIRCICPELSEEDVRECWSVLDGTLIQAIDAWDNGETPDPDEYSITGILSCFNPPWDSREDRDAAFLEAVRFSQTILTVAVRRAASRISAKRLVEAAIARTGGHILLLDEPAPWQEIVRTAPGADQLYYVVFPSIREGYCCQCVPCGEDRFSQRRPLPKAWHGAGRDRLRELTGVKTALFCHPAGFICGAQTLEDTLLLASLACREAGE